MNVKVLQHLPANLVAAWHVAAAAAAAAMAVFRIQRRLVCRIRM